jgi:hypothetical protein
LRTLPTLLSTGQTFSARPQQRAQFLFGSRLFAKSFRPIVFAQDDRHAVMDFRHRIVQRAHQDGAELAPPFAGSFTSENRVFGSHTARNLHVDLSLRD